MIVYEDDDVLCECGHMLSGHGRGVERICIQYKGPHQPENTEYKRMCYCNKFTPSLEGYVKYIVGVSK